MADPNRAGRARTAMELEAELRRLAPDLYDLLKQPRAVSDWELRLALAPPVPSPVLTSLGDAQHAQELAGSGLASWARRASGLDTLHVGNSFRVDVLRRMPKPNDEDWARVIDACRAVAAASRQMSESASFDQRRLQVWSDLIAAAPSGWAAGPSGQQVAERLIAATDGAMPRAELLAWVEAARALVPCFGEAMEVAAVRVGQRLRRVDLREEDERVLANVYVRRRPLEAFARLLTEGAPRALHLVGSGGVGKTIIMRQIALRRARPGASAPDDPLTGLNYVVARVDFDLLSPEFPVRAPGLLLQHFADSLLAEAQATSIKRFERMDYIARELADTPPDPATLSDWSVATRHGFMLDAFVQGLRFFDLPVVLLIDTCEELERVAGGSSLALVSTLAMVERLIGYAAAEPVGSPIRSLRVVFSGRRPLADAGGVGRARWRLRDEKRRDDAGSGRPPRTLPWLDVYHVRGFSADEARGYLRAQLGGGPSARQRIDTVLGACKPAPQVALFVNQPDRAKTRYIPYDLALFVDWVSSNPDVSAEELSKGLDRYVEVRLTDRAPELGPLWPLLALVGEVDALLLHALRGQTPAELAGLFDTARRQDWAERVGSTPLGARLGAPRDRIRVPAELQGRLHRWAISEPRRAAALGDLERDVGELLRHRVLEGAIEPEGPEDAGWVCAEDVALALCFGAPEGFTSWWEAAHARLGLVRNPQRAENIAGLASAWARRRSKGAPSWSSFEIRALAAGAATTRGEGEITRAWVAPDEVPRPPDLAACAISDEIVGLERQVGNRGWRPPFAGLGLGTALEVIASQLHDWAKAARPDALRSERARAMLVGAGAVLLDRLDDELPPGPTLDPAPFRALAEAARDDLPQLRTAAATLRLRAEARARPEAGGVALAALAGVLVEGVAGWQEWPETRWLGWAWQDNAAIALDAIAASNAVAFNPVRRAACPPNPFGDLGEGAGAASRVSAARLRLAVLTADTLPAPPDSDWATAEAMPPTRPSTALLRTAPAVDVARAEAAIEDGPTFLGSLSVPRAAIDRASTNALVRRVALHRRAWRLLTQDALSPERASDPEDLSTLAACVLLVMPMDWAAAWPDPDATAPRADRLFAAHLQLRRARLWRPDAAEALLQAALDDWPVDHPPDLADALLRLDLAEIVAAADPTLARPPDLRAHLAALEVAHPRWALRLALRAAWLAPQDRLGPLAALAGIWIGSADAERIAAEELAVLAMRAPALAIRPLRALAETVASAPLRRRLEILLVLTVRRVRGDAPWLPDPLTIARRWSASVPGGEEALARGELVAWGRGAGLLDDGWFERLVEPTSERDNFQVTSAESVVPVRPRLTPALAEAIARRLGRADDAAVRDALSQGEPGPEVGKPFYRDLGPVRAGPSIDGLRKAIGEIGLEPWAALSQGRGMRLTPVDDAVEIVARAARTQQLDMAIGGFPMVLRMPGRPESTLSVSPMSSEPLPLDLPEGPGPIRVNLDRSCALLHWEQQIARAAPTARVTRRVLSLSNTPFDGSGGCVVFVDEERSRPLLAPSLERVSPYEVARTGPWAMLHITGVPIRRSGAAVLAERRGDPDRDVRQRNPRLVGAQQIAQARPTCCVLQASTYYLIERSEVEIEEAALLFWMGAELAASGVPIVLTVPSLPGDVVGSLRSLGQAMDDQAAGRPVDWPLVARQVRAQIRETLSAMGLVTDAAFDVALYQAG